ncbi:MULTISPECIES: hypothetical protein [Streptomyces]|nr:MULTISPECIES: hypothetical protein [Streptomyces]
MQTTSVCSGCSARPGPIAIAFAVTQPAPVDVSDIVVRPTAQS